MRQRGVVAEHEMLLGEEEGVEAVDLPCWSLEAPPQGVCNLGQFARNNLLQGLAHQTSFLRYHTLPICSISSLPHPQSHLSSLRGQCHFIHLPPLASHPLADPEGSEEGV